MPERRQNWLLGLAATIALVLILLLVAIPLAFDRLADRLTASISSEVHSEMWEQIRQNAEQQSADRRLMEEKLTVEMQTQKVYIDTMREKVIKYHPGDSK